jgi:hypothetical protein
MWANYFATGNVALLKKIIKEALPLAAQARVLASNPTDAQLLMQTCNFAAVTLINEGTHTHHRTRTRTTAHAHMTKC